MLRFVIKNINALFDEYKSKVFLQANIFERNSLEN